MITNCPRQFIYYVIYNSSFFKFVFEENNVNTFTISQLAFKTNSVKCQIIYSEMEVILIFFVTFNSSLIVGGLLK